MPNENATPVAPEGGSGNPPAAPAPAAIVAESAPAPADTRSWVPDKLRGHKSLEKFKSVDDALNGYINLEGSYGKKFEEHLKEDAAPEIKARVRAAMGVPDSVAGYEPPKAPEGYTLDEGLVSNFQKIAHEAGLSKSAWQKLSDSFVQLEMERMTQRSAESAKAQETGMAELNKKWGAAAPRNLGLVHKVVAEYGGAELRAALDETGAGNDPRVVAFLARMGQTLAEDNLMTPNPVGVSVDDAKKEIAAIRAAAVADRKHPYTNKEHPQHKEFLAKMAALNELAHSEI